MEKNIVPTSKIPFRTLLVLIEAVDTLRGELENLGRVSRGAINATSKNKVGKLVAQFKKSTDEVMRDDMLNLAIRNMVLIAEIIKNTPSYDGNGYAVIERNVVNLLYQIGFIKGN